MVEVERGDRQMGWHGNGSAAAMAWDRVDADSDGDLGELFASMRESSGTCVVVLDCRLRVLAVNECFFRVFDRTPAEVHGRGFGEFLHPSVVDHLGGLFGKIMDGMRRRLNEHVVGLRSDGSVFPGRLIVSPLCDADNRVSGMVALLKLAKTDPDNQFVLKCRDQVLTALDAKIMEGVAAGISSARLATRLHMSRQGVEYHVGVMMRKLNASNRSALVSRAYSLGILSVGCWPPRVLAERVK